MEAMRRLLLLLVAMFAVSVSLVPSSAFAAAPPNSGGAGSWAGAGAGADGASGAAAPTTSIDNSFLNTKRDISQCLNNSIDLPDCGVEPTTPGARGGWLQGVTFGVLGVGITIISWRVVKSVKARDKALQSHIS